MAYRRTEKVAQKLEDKQQALLAAAIELFGEKGYHQASVKDIASLAGVATGTFYLYFRNKESLFTALVEISYRRLVEAIRQERKAAGAGVQEKLATSMRTVLRFFGQHRGPARLALLEVPRVHPRLREQVADFQVELVTLVRQDLEEAGSQGLIPAQDCHLTAQAIVGGFNQVITGWLRSGETTSLEAAGEGLVAFMLRGAGFAEEGQGRAASRWALPAPGEPGAGEACPKGMEAGGNSLDSTIEVIRKGG